MEKLSSGSVIKVCIVLYCISRLKTELYLSLGPRERKSPYRRGCSLSRFVVEIEDLGLICRVQDEK